MASLLALLRLLEGETLITTDCARAWVNIVNKTLNLEVRRHRLFSKVLAVHFFIHADLCVGHSNVRVGVSSFLVCVLVDVSLLHIISSAVAEVVCDHGVNWGWGPVSLTKCEGFVGKVCGLLLDESERNAGIVGSTELVLFVRSDSFRLKGHFVKFFEVTRILTGD